MYRKMKIQSMIIIIVSFTMTYYQYHKTNSHILQNKNLNENNLKTKNITQQIKKSQIDTRIYKSIQLSNNLQCLLISDKDTEKSAAALNVNVGTFEDPYDRQGLAHFCEHMLFMGTNKYPLESEYNDYISKNSGETNAFSSQLETNYYFSVANDAFYGALDRFSQFFTNPLFDQSCTEREMKAVESEFNMNLQNDFWRQHQLIDSMADENSEMRKFMIGNLQTLQFDDIRERLLQFHNKWYSANIMKLVIYGKQPIEELEQWAQELFSDILNKDINVPSYQLIPYTTKNLGKIVRFVPFNDQDFIEFIWFVDYLHPHYKNSPGSYISFLLGHEGKNSLLSVLIDEGLALGLSAFPNDEMRLYSTINVIIRLTQKGLKNIYSIINYISQYMKMLKDKGIQSWLFEEIQAMDQLNFRYLEKSKPINYVSSLASRLQSYPIEQVLEAPYLMEKYDEQLIQQTLNQLDNKKLLIIVSSKEFENKLGSIEPQFGTEYEIENFDKKVYNNLELTTQLKSKKQLDLPAKNIYLPQSTELNKIELEEPTQYPQKVFETDQSDLWFKRDDKFGVPKAIIQVVLYCNDAGYGTLPLTQLLARVWYDVLNDHIREFIYHANIVKISLVENGIDVQISGFSDKMQIFSEELFRQIRNFDIGQYKDKLHQYIEKLRQQLENFQRQPPYKQIQTYLGVILQQGGNFDPILLLKNINDITDDGVLQFSNNWLKKGRFEWFITGNLPLKVALKIVKSTENTMNLQTLIKQDNLQQRTVNIPMGHNYHFSFDLKEENNSAVLLYYQHEPIDLRNQLLNGILANIIQSPFFEKLRTQEQLGYVVFSSVSDIRGNIGFNLIIQSHDQPSQYSQERIFQFINLQMLEKIQNMEQNQFEQYKQSIKITILEKDFSLQNEFAKQWSEIVNHLYRFDKKNKQLDLLDQITLEEIINLYQQVFIQKPKILEIHAISHKHKEQNDNLSIDLNCNKIKFNFPDFLKTKLTLYPDYYSLI